MSQWSLLVWLVLPLVGCSNPAAEQPASAVSPDLGPPPAPTRLPAQGSGGELALSYRGPDGAWLTVQSPAEVPEAARGEVVVVDLRRSPAERGADRWVEVADLRQAQPDGLYAVQVLPRARWDRERHPSPAPSDSASAPAPGTTSQRLVMFSTRHCPVCTQARRFLQASDIPFVERDVETDPAAASELQRRARQAGVPANGVPVFEYRGRLLTGFDKTRLLALLGRS